MSSHTVAATPQTTYSISAISKLLQTATYCRNDESNAKRLDRMGHAFGLLREGEQELDFAQTVAGRTG